MCLNANTHARLLAVITRVVVMALALPLSSTWAADLDVNKITKGESWFPWVVGGKAHVAERINDVIFYDFFGTAAPPTTQPGLEHVDLEHTIPYGFGLLRNDGHVLSLSVEGEGCGAYCETFERAYAFDTASGRRILIEDLFTEAGIHALGRKSYASVLTAIRTEIKRLRSADDESLSVEERDDIISQFEECALWRSGKMERNNVAPGEMRIDADGVEFTHGRCSNHALQALDALGDFHYRVSSSELQAWLTPYGRALIIGAGSAKAPETPFGQVLIGTVGKSKVQVSLSTLYENGSFGGHYYYTRYRKLIALQGKAGDDRLTLTEMDENQKAQAHWTLTRVADGWEGTWRGNKGREYPIRLQ